MAWVAEHGGGVRRNGELVRREPAGDQPQGATSIWSRRGRQPGRPAEADRHVGVLRRRLPEADRGRGRLRALRPHQPVGPPARHADGARGRAVLPPTATALPTPHGRARPAWSSPPTRPRSRAPARPAPTSGRADRSRDSPTNLDVSAWFRVQRSSRVTSRVTAPPSGAGVGVTGREAWEPPGPQHIERTLRDPLTVDPGRHRPEAPGGQPSRLPRLRDGVPRRWWSPPTWASARPRRPPPSRPRRRSPRSTTSRTCRPTRPARPRS